MCCLCWWCTDNDDAEEDGYDTDAAAANIAATNANALAAAVEMNETAPRAAREPPPIAMTDAARERNYARYARTARRIANSHGRDAITLAAYFDDVDIMRLFIADASVPRGLFEDALKLAVVQGNLRVAELLLSSGVTQGASADTNRFRAPLRLAALKGNRDMFALVVRHTRLRPGESIARVVQDILLDGAGRNTLAMLLCVTEMPGGTDPVHWKDALAAAASHVHYRPAVLRLCLAFDRGASAVDEAVDTAFFVGNASALRVLSHVPRVQPPRKPIRPVYASPAAERVARLMRARVLLVRRNGLRRAILFAQSFRERFYAPDGVGFVLANHRFESTLSEAAKNQDED